MVKKCFESLLIPFFLTVLLGGILFSHSFPETILDVRFTYSVQDVQSLISRLGPTGRAAYFQNEVFDLIFIWSYTWFTYALLKRLATRFAPEKNPTLWVWAALPGLFDGIETVGILILLKQDPELDPTLIHLVKWATPLKWVSFSFPISQAILFVWRKRHQK